MSDVITILLPLMGGVGGAFAAAGVALWRQALTRIDRLQADAERWEKQLQECIDARGRAEARLEAIEQEMRRLRRGNGPSQR